jgi:hypothetical protein
VLNCVRLRVRQGPCWGLRLGIGTLTSIFLDPGQIVVQQMRQRVVGDLCAAPRCNQFVAAAKRFILVGPQIDLFPAERDIPRLGEITEEGFRLSHH